MTKQKFEILFEQQICFTESKILQQIASYNNVQIEIETFIDEVI